MNYSGKYTTRDAKRAGMREKQPKKKTQNDMAGIEERTADTILQKPETVTVGGKEYEVAPPSIATLVLASKYISRLPQVKLDQDNVLGDVLAVAKDCGVIGDILAILILGAKESEKAADSCVPSLISRIFRWNVETKRERLAKELLEAMKPRDAYSLLAKLVGNLQIADFFGLTTFLIGVNMTKATKVETETTASGR